MTTVLIVDDSLTQRIHLRSILEQDNHTVLEAKGGFEALDIASTYHPDCILLDYIMPNGNGVDVLVGLRERRLSIPVIMVTSDTNEITRQQCLNLGAAVFMNKPKDGNELRGVIFDVLG